MFLVEVVGSLVRTTAQRMGPSIGLAKEPPIERQEASAAAAQGAADALMREMLDDGWVDPGGYVDVANLAALPQPTTEPVVYDKADWHAGTCDEQGLDPHQAFVHTGLFVTWLIDHDMFAGEFAAAAPEVKARALTGPSFFEREVDGTLVDEMLTADGNAFAQAYFDLDAGQYLSDYGDVFAIDQSDPAAAYSVEDTWESYDKLRPVIDARYAVFRAAVTAKARRPTS